MAALTVLLDRVKAAHTTARAELHTQLRNGDSATVWSPLRDGEEIASVNRSKPKATAHVIDDQVYGTWLAKEYPEAVTHTRTATPEGLEYLADAAPELLDERVEIAEWAHAAGLKQAVSKLADPVPGVEVVKAPVGRLSVRLADNAYELVTELIERGLIDLHGEPREVEA